MKSVVLINDHCRAECGSDGVRVPGQMWNVWKLSWDIYV